MLRKRNLFLMGGALIVAALSFYTDPDSHGYSTIFGFLAIAQGLWAVVAAHLARKWLLDYNEADQRQLFKIAKGTPQGAGLALIAMAIVFAALLMAFAPRAHAGGFDQYGSTLTREIDRTWSDHPDRPALAALVEQESGWKVGARLKSNREEGAGLGQITRAWAPDGTLRFDNLATMQQRIPELSWSTIYQRPDLQLRALVIMAKDAATPFRHAPDWLLFGDAAYNGGIGGVQRERRACGMTAGCDPGRWFGNVDGHCLKSHKNLYGNLSPCMINREHVRQVFRVRRLHYVGRI